MPQPQLTPRRWAQQLLMHLALLVLPTGCSCDVPEAADQFSCGGPRMDSPAEALVCDRAQERCICDGQRCALPEPECPSGYKYSLGLFEECVPPERMASALPAGVSAASGFCDGLGPQTNGCGLPGGRRCRDGEVCGCVNNECLIPVNAAECATRYRRRDGSCVTEATHVEPSRLAFPDADGGATVCPPSLGIPCGVPLAGGDVRGCGAGGLCACALSIPECLRRSGDCDSGYARASGGDGECIGGFTSRELELSAPATDGALCPALTGAPCGRTGAASCPAGTQCNCADNQCVEADEACQTGLRYSRAPGMCVDDAMARGRQVDGMSVCPVQPAITCGLMRSDGEVVVCPGTDVCLCSENRCIYESSTCESGRAYADDYTCVDATALMANGGPPTGNGSDECPNRVECGGGEGSGQCESDEVCVCNTRRCARAASAAECAATRLAYVRAAIEGPECVIETDAFFDLLTTSDTQSCPGLGIETPCGVRSVDGNGQPCGGSGEVCLCDLPVPRCAIPLARCPETGWAFAHDHTCIPSTVLTRDAIEMPMNALGTGNLCAPVPDAGVSPDAGVDGGAG